VLLIALHKFRNSLWNRRNGPFNTMSSYFNSIHVFLTYLPKVHFKTAVSETICITLASEGSVGTFVSSCACAALKKISYIFCFNNYLRHVWKVRRWSSYSSSVLYTTYKTSYPDRALFLFWEDDQFIEADRQT